MAKDKGLLFFYDWKPVFEELQPEDCKALILAMLEYKQNQTPPPEFTGAAKIAALLIFPAIDRSEKLSAAGRNGGLKTQQDLKGASSHDEEDSKQASKGASSDASSHGSSHGSSTKQNKTKTKQDKNKEIPPPAEPLPAEEEKITEEKKPQKRRYGQYNNVLLTDEEYSVLQAEFPSDYRDRIERLSEYIESKGEKYKSHIATIRSWARRDREKETEGHYYGGKTDAGKPDPDESTAYEVELPF